jgi:RimJ/RimL family protein N-acetyltransferase
VFTAILETARLRLREMVEADVHDVYLLNSSPNVMRYLGAERPLSSLDEALTLLRERIFPQYQSYGVGVGQ